MGITVKYENTILLKRPAVYQNNHLLFTVSTATYKKLIKNKEPVTPEQLPEIAAYERKHLQQSMEQYLAAACRPPRALALWLKKRKIPADWEKELTDYAYAAHLIDQQYFTELFFSKALRKGNKPYFRLVQELTAKGINKEYINNREYDETKALHNYIKNRSLAERYSFKQTYAKLASLGYSYSLIKKVLKNYYDKIY